MSDSKRYSIGIDVSPYLWTLGNENVDPPDFSPIPEMPEGNGPDNPVLLEPGSLLVFSIGTGDFHYFQINVE